MDGDAAGMLLEILENLVSGDVDSKKISAAANTARLVDTHENIVVLFDILETAEVREGVFVCFFSVCVVVVFFMNNFLFLIKSK
jgi:hypothetical protein